MGLDEFFSNPYLINILIVVAIISLVMAIAKKKSKAFIFIGLISLVIIFVGSFALAKINLLIFCLAFVAGVFFVIEVLVPGFGIFGALGIGLTILSVVLLNIPLAIRLSSISLGLIFNVFFLVYVLKSGFRDKNLSNIVLNERIEKNIKKKDLVGSVGTSLSILRPSGWVSINGQRYEAVSQGEFIAKTKTIEVIDIEGNRLIVKEI